MMSSEKSGANRRDVSDVFDRMYGPNKNLFMYPNDPVRIQWSHPKGFHVGFLSISCENHSLTPAKIVKCVLKADKVEKLRRIALSGGCVHGNSGFVYQVKEALRESGVESVWRDYIQYSSYPGSPLVGQSNLIGRFVRKSFKVTYSSWEAMVAQELQMVRLSGKAESKVVEVAREIWDKMRNTPDTVNARCAEPHTVVCEALGLVTLLQERGELADVV